MEDTQARTTRVSPSTGRRYPLTMIWREYRLARSSVYAARRHSVVAPGAQRGSKTVVSDVELVAAIRTRSSVSYLHLFQTLEEARRIIRRVLRALQHRVAG